MPSYRVEVSANNRAGCQDAFCKKNGIKIMKGEIRFGVWLEGSANGHDFASWRWRHWGCVSGKTMQHIRENLSGLSAEEGEYNWDYMDGLEEMPPEYQEKIKHAIIEGKIADEDWLGDPGFNVLGKTGIRARASTKKKTSEELEVVRNLADTRSRIPDSARRSNGMQPPETATTSETPSKPATKKRGRGKNEDEEDEKETKPAKKRAVRAKKEEEDEDSKPVKKSRAKKEVKDEDDDEYDSKPVRKSRGKRVAKSEEPEPYKNEESDASGVDIKPTGKARVKKEAKKEEDVEQVKRESDQDVDIKPVRTRRGRKVKKQEEQDGGELKFESKDEVDLDIKPVKKRGGKIVPKEEKPDPEIDIKTESNDEVDTRKRPTTKSSRGRAIKKEEADNNAKMKNEDDFESDEDVKPAFRNEGQTGSQGMKMEDSGNEYIKRFDRPKMPDDPLKRIEGSFCDRDGPLMKDFNEMVEAQEIAEGDWDGFLRKKYRALVAAELVDEGDYQGFLQQMHHREMEALEPALATAIAPKKGRKTRRATNSATKPRPRRGKTS